MKSVLFVDSVLYCRYVRYIRLDVEMKIINTISNMYHTVEPIETTQGTKEMWSL